MTKRYQRRPKGNEYIPITVRYTPETYNAIRKYAFENNASMALANEKLIKLGLQQSVK